MKIKYKISESIIKERMQICKGCEEYSYQFDMCRVCQCNVKRKIKVPFAECPKGKWMKCELLK